MKINITFLTTLSLLLIESFGRSALGEEYIPCYSDERLILDLVDNPRLQTKMEEIEQHWRANPNYYNKSEPQVCTVNCNNRMRMRIESLPSPLTIPINVHIIKSPNTKYIGYEQIISQIRSINKDFMKENSDITTIADFAELAGDFNINFALNKIIRKNTFINAFNPKTNDMKFTSKGGSNGVDSAFSLNLWVAELGSVLGFASFPGGPLNVDGVVIDPQCFGNIEYKQQSNNIQWYINSPFNLGRTTTHEIGHWLNLRHIWGDARLPFFTGCRYDDLVTDTPVDEAPNYGCPANDDPISCGSKDMYMNFMDYVNDDCMNMFTKGQIDRADDIFLSGGAREFFTDYAINPSLIKFVNYFYFIYGDNEICDNGHIKRELDLNNGVSDGDNIYLCISYSNNPHIDVIADINIIIDEYDKDVECPSSYEKINSNLNAGTHGKYIYVCYKKESQSTTTKIITDLNVFEFDTKYIQSTYNGYNLIPVNLNNGTDGQWIYLSYKTNI